MKRLLSVGATLVLSIQMLKAQELLRKVFTGETPLTFLGLDFSHAHFIGMDASAVQSSGFLSSMNSLIVLDEKKYSLRNALRIPHDSLYHTSVDDMVRINQLIDIPKRFAAKSLALDSADVQASVKHYSLPNNKGIGLVYVVENLDRPGKLMTLWATFIDMQTSEILYTERLAGKPGGLSRRAYWTFAVKRIKKEIQKDYYHRWRQKALSR